MKRLLKQMCFVICISSATLAFAAPTSGFRTPHGQLVNVGDSMAKAQDALKSAPISSSSSIVTEGEKTFDVHYYTYKVDGILYTLKVKNQVIESIDWVRAS